MSKTYAYTPHPPRPAFGGRLEQVDPLCLDILWHRGFRTQEEMEAVLFPDMDRLLADDYPKDTDKAISVLKWALENDKHITVYQDYDADGCCACAIVMECLRKLGGKVSNYCNDRAVDGFGLCINGIDNLLTADPDTAVILTVDNGTVAVDAVEYAKSKGLKVVVSDHHEPGETLPDADAVVNAKRKDETYPYHDLCGAGVAFKLMLCLYRNLGRDITPVINTLDIAALATVADVVPVLGENRAIIHKGLELIRAGKRPAFDALNRVMEPKAINAQYTLAFIYAPMINALNRMGADPGLAVELFLTEDDDRAGDVVLELKDLNEERKELTDEQKQVAEAMVDPNHLPPAIILYSDQFSEGLVGIIAGRLKDKFDRPAIVFANSGDGELKGSARSTGEVNIKEALDAVSDLTVAHGGHAKAAGLTIKKDKFNGFKKALLDVVAPMVKGVSESIELDAILDAGSVTGDMITELSLLEPFGEGFRPPIFQLNANAKFDRVMGSLSQHIKFKDGDLAIIRWNGAADYLAGEIVPDYFIGQLSLNEWRGTVTPQFICEN